MKRQIDRDGEIDVEKLQVSAPSLNSVEGRAELERALRGIRQLTEDVRTEAGRKGQPNQPGYDRRDIFKYRIGFNSVLSSNGQYIIFPWEHLGSNESDPTGGSGGRGGQRNLSFIRLPEAQVRLSLRNSKAYLDEHTGPVFADPFSAPAPPSLRFRATDPLTHRSALIELPVNAKMKSFNSDDDTDESAEAARFREALGDVFGDDYVLASGGPIAKGVPVTISLLGQVGYTPATGGKFAVLPGEQALVIEEEPRYLKVTPSTIELRRQVMDVEKDILDIKTGWIGVGYSKHDVPEDACYVARWRDCGVERYVWVCPGFRKEFEDFTIKVLNFSSLIKNVQITGSAGVKFSPGTSSGFFPR
jgi:hypothetical protein